MSAPTATPRTDASEYTVKISGTPMPDEVVAASFARGLENELAAERARMDWLLSKMGGLVLPANRCVAWTVAFYDYENRFPSRSAIDRALGGGPK